MVSKKHNSTVLDKITITSDIRSLDKETLKIKFVDLGFDDLLTPEEWEDGLKQFT